MHFVPDFSRTTSWLTKCESQTENEIYGQRTTLIRFGIMQNAVKKIGKLIYTSLE